MSDKYLEVELLDHMVGDNQGNANQNYSETSSLHTCQDAIIKNVRDNKCLQGCKKKGNSHRVGGNAKWYSHQGRWCYLLAK